MRLVHSGIVVVVIAAAYGGLIVWRLLSAATPELASPQASPIDLNAVKSDLCRLAEAERDFLAATGYYAPENELRSNGDPTLPTGLSPYRYEVLVPAPDRFVIVAAPTSPKESRIPSIVADSKLQVCTVKAKVPQLIAWKLGVSPQPENASSSTYECQECP